MFYQNYFTLRIYCPDSLYFQNDVAWCFIFTLFSCYHNFLNFGNFCILKTFWCQNYFILKEFLWPQLILYFFLFFWFFVTKCFSVGKFFQFFLTFLKLQIPDFMSFHIFPFFYKSFRTITTLGAVFLFHRYYVTFVTNLIFFVWLFLYFCHQK